VIQKSSNIGASRDRPEDAPREIVGHLHRARLRPEPQIQFPGAVHGGLRPWKSWKPVEQATMAYGYGLSASLFQMAHSYTAFAHDGAIIPATILKSSEPAGRRQGVLARERAGGAQDAADGGRPRRHRSAARRPSATRWRQVGHAPQAGRQGLREQQYRSWFTGMAPIEKPRIIVAVMIDEPSTASTSAACGGAVFSEVVQQTLRMMNVAPDLAVKPLVVTKGVEKSF
jgi:cell division protein FtsI (penicillin-binding protein 3)